MTNAKLFGRILMTLATASILTACGNNGVDVVAIFSNTQDIKDGAVVYFENQAVGEVTDVDSDGNGAVVKLSLSKEAAKMITSNAAIVVNQLKEDAPLEIYNRYNSVELGVTDGQELRGLDSMFQLGAWMVSDAIQLGSGSVSQYLESFQKYLQGEQFQNDKIKFKKQIHQATDAATDALKIIESDVNNTVQEFTGPEGEAAKAMEQLGEELAKSATVLVEQLEKFNDGLQQQTDQGEQQADQSFLDSLVLMLEKLNQSIDDGANGQSEAEVESSN